MKIKFHKNFEKQYKKLKINEKKKVISKLTLFFEDEFNPILNNHPLRGAYNGYRSSNINGNIRAIYKRTSRDLVVFVAVDTHSNLYR